MKRVAVVTGGNRGLGFETCRELGQKGYTVILTARDEEKGNAAARKLRDEKIDVQFHKLDVTSREDILRLRDFVEKNFGRLDVLVNNAGILPDARRSGGAGSDTLNAKVETLKKAMETNVYGPFQLCQVFIPLMEKNNYGRIVNVSSGMGQLTEMNGGFPGYRISKTGLNAVTRIFADDLEGKNILINSICPGWVKTDLGGPDAEVEVPDAARNLVWAATLPDGGPSGSFFRNREPLAW